LPLVLQDLQTGGTGISGARAIQEKLRTQTN
jgi:hypothetical protein